MTTEHVTSPLSVGFYPITKAEKEEVFWVVKSHECSEYAYLGLSVFFCFSGKKILKFVSP